MVLAWADVAQASVLGGGDDIQQGSGTRPCAAFVHRLNHHVLPSLFVAAVFILGAGSAFTVIVINSIDRIQCGRNCTDVIGQSDPNSNEARVACYYCYNVAGVIAVASAHQLLRRRAKAFGR